MKQRYTYEQLEQWLREHGTIHGATIENITLSGGPGIPAVGSVLSVATPGSPITYRPLGNAGNQKWTLKRKTADVTNQGTPWTQIIGTLLDGGTFTCDLHFIPGSIALDSSGAFGHGFASGLGALFTQFLNALYSWQLTFPNGDIIYFTGAITDYTMDMNLEKDLLVNLSIMVSGEPQFISA